MEDEDWIWQARVRSRALMTAGKGTMATSVLLEEVSTWTRQERASAGASLAPGRTFQTRSKSWRKSDHRACCLDNL